ncbi:MAG: proteasome subunit beta [Candidatus Micrarchaeia archaeon]
MDYRKIAEKAMKGTTTIGVICADGVVMGADSRATMDTFIASSEAIKIYKINEKLGLTVAGDVGSAEYLAKLLKVQNDAYKMEENVPLNPTSATSILHIILQENKMFPFIVQLLVGGFNKDTPELYSLDPLGGYIKESKFTSTGSGSLTALGYLEEVYKKDITVQEATKIVAKGLKIAMKRDSATGDKIHIVTITKSGYKELSSEEIEKLLK